MNIFEKRQRDLAIGDNRDFAANLGFLPDVGGESSLFSL
jgi:hypothetical protein